MRAIVCSEKDTASENLFARFLELGFTVTRKTWEGKAVFQFDDVLLVRTQELHIRAEHLTGLDISEIVFASQHSSRESSPVFTVHPTGNFGPADFGGRPRMLSPVSAQTLRNIFLELKNNRLGFKATMEATHHGPLLGKPCLFAEIGSTQTQWEDEEAAFFLASCILKGLQSNNTAETVIGLAKGHYVPRFCDLAERYAFGHMCPDYALALLDKSMLQQMVEKTIPQPRKILIDRRVQAPPFLQDSSLEVVAV